MKNTTYEKQQLWGSKMVVERKVLEKKGKKSEVRKNGVFEEKIFDYLKKHSDKGFSQGELSKIFDRSEQQCRKVCLNLVRKNIVDRLEIPEKTREGKIIQRIYYIVKQ